MTFPCHIVACSRSIRHPIPTEHRNNGEWRRKIGDGEGGLGDTDDAATHNGNDFFKVYC